MRGILCAVFIACGSLGAQPLYVQAGDSLVIAQTRPKIDQEGFEKRLNDVRSDIKDRTNTPRPDTSAPDISVDVCKRNPSLPQCKIK